MQKMWNNWWWLGLLLPWATAALAAQFTEGFVSSPLQRGWKQTGVTNLFVWNATNQNLEVTWDSSRSNSFFYLPLGTVVGKEDNFRFAFDLNMQDIAAGATAGKPYTFQIALGLFNSTNVISTNFFRGAGRSLAYGPRNLVTFDYFPDTEVVDATFAMTSISANTTSFLVSHNHPLLLDPGVLYHIEMVYTAADHTLRMNALRDGLPFGTPPNNTMEAIDLTTSEDFRVDCFAVCSYNDDHQPPFGAAGSVLAHGTVDNVSITCPEPPLNRIAGGVTNTAWELALPTNTNWVFTLQRSLDLKYWTNVTSGTGKPSILLRDTNQAVLNAGFYRIAAERP